MSSKIRITTLLKVHRALGFGSTGSCEMGDHTRFLKLDNCPHCKTSHPTLYEVGLSIKDRSRTQYAITSNDYGLNFNKGTSTVIWRAYICSFCCNMTTARYEKNQSLMGFLREVFPSSRNPILEEISRFSEEIGDLLKEASDSMTTNPGGSIMTAAAAVDMMLMKQGGDYEKDEKLYDRINLATQKHLITEEMSKWAHAVRLEANKDRHPSKKYVRRTQTEAEEAINFAITLAEYLIVLPEKVKKHLNNDDKHDEKPNRINQ